MVELVLVCGILLFCFGLSFGRIGGFCCVGGYVLLFMFIKYGGVLGICILGWKGVGLVMFCFCDVDIMLCIFCVVELLILYWEKLLLIVLDVVMLFLVFNMLLMFRIMVVGGKGCGINVG